MGFLAAPFCWAWAAPRWSRHVYAAAEIFPLGQQAKVIGLIVFAGTVGAIGGPLLVEPAVGLARQQGFHEHVGPFWISAALMAVALILLLVALRPRPKELAALLESEKGCGQGSGGFRGRLARCPGLYRWKRPEGCNRSCGCSSCRTCSWR